MIAHAPDQWWAIFSPIWPDLEAEAAGEAVDAPATGNAKPDPSANPGEGEPEAAA